ncbi:MAG: TolC family protein, partial [Phaeodactylibacter sp.]|nr:TolC family protein [Phaeodactylibacter sp.]
LTATGRGADIMLPMAIPSFGGMTLQMITMFTVPVLYALWQESRLRFQQRFRPGNMATVLLIGGLVSLLSLPSATAQPLDTLLTQANKENLELQRLDKEFQAALQRAPQVSQLPDPEIGLGAFPLPVETRLGAQAARFSATQPLPWFGTREQSAALEDAKALALQERSAAEQLNLAYNLKTAYFRLYEIEKSRSILLQNQELLKALEQVALAKIESGQATAADALRVQLSFDELQLKLQLLEIAKTDPTATINQLLNRALDTPIAIRDSMAFATLPFNQDSLVAALPQQHPAIQLFERQQEVSRQALVLNELAGKPSFGVGLDYILVNPRDDADPAGNGRDILQLKAAVKVPIYRKRYAAKTAEENLKIAALEDQKRSVESQFGAAIAKAYARYEAAQLNVEFYEKQVRTTQSIIRILEADYSAKGRNFEELLRLEKNLVDYQLKQLQAIVESHLAKSSIERFIP